jgi:thiosulfate/3-mercaptopyruvate sulfurtransferase
MRFPPTASAPTTAALAAAAALGLSASLAPIAAQQLQAGPAAAGEAPGMLVSTEWLAARLGDPSVVVLHVDAQRAAYAQAHIPGARFLDLNGIAWNGEPDVGTEMRTPGEIEAALEAVGVTDTGHLVVYGANPLAAARAWMTLDVMGIGDRTSFLDGGLGAWQEEGRAVATEEPSFAPGSVTLRPRAGVMVDAAWIHARLDDPALTLIDARPDEEYTGADNGLGGRVHPGHIPGAYQIWWEKLVQSRPIHRAHPLEELRALHRASGAADGSTVAVYCMVGARASYAYLTARRLGYDVKFYDGSWRDWGSRDLPYVTGTARR